MELGISIQWLKLSADNVHASASIAARARDEKRPAKYVVELLSYLVYTRNYFDGELAEELRLKLEFGIGGPFKPAFNFLNVVWWRNVEHFRARFKHRDCNAEIVVSLLQLPEDFAA